MSGGGLREGGRADAWRWRCDQRYAKGDHKGAVADAERFLVVSHDEKDKAEVRAKLAKMRRD